MKEPIVDSNKLCEDEEVEKIAERYLKLNEDEEDKEKMKSIEKWFEVFLFISIVLGFFLLGWVCNFIG